jgi:hypothetical protein
MNDLENRLRDSLQEAGRSFTSSRSAAPSQRFLKARRRRMFVRGAGVVAMAAVLIVAAVLVLPTDRTIDDPVPVGPGPVPQGPMEITTRIDVGPQPLGLAVGDERVYVGHMEGGALEVVDPSTDEIVDDFEDAQGHSSRYVAVGDGRLWRAQPFILDAVDLESGEVVGRGIKIGEPSDIVYGGDSVWIAHSGFGPPDDYLISRFSSDLSGSRGFSDHGPGSLFSGPSNLAYGYGALWATANGGKAGGLVRIDAETEELESVPGIDSASDVAVGAGAVWVYENSSKALRSRLLRVDPETLEVEEKAIVLGYFAWLEADENGVWVLNASDETDRRLLRIEPVSGDSMGTALKLGTGPFEMTSGFDSIWITDEGNGELLRVDVTVEDGAP